MSFRQYGGINYAARNNIVKNNYTNANNLSVMTKVGQPVSYINFESDISGNTIYGPYDFIGDVTITGNLSVTGATTLSSTLDVTGATTLSSTLDVTGATTLSANTNAYKINLTGDINTYQDATSLVPKSYVDGISAGIHPTVACQLATAETSGLITLSGNQLIDGILTSTGNRVLVNNQGYSAGTETNNNSIANGIYVASNSTWSRAADCNGNNVQGQSTFIQFGATNSKKTFVQTASGANPAIAGTDPLLYVVYNQLNLELGQGLEFANSSTLQMKSDLSTSPFITSLGVNGATTLTGTLGVTGNVTLSNDINFLNNTAQERKILFCGVTDTGYIKFHSFLDSDSYLEIGTTDDNVPIHFTINDTASSPPNFGIMTLNTNGLTINYPRTSVPSNYALDVSGNMNVTNTTPANNSLSLTSGTLGQYFGDTSLISSYYTNVGSNATFIDTFAYRYASGSPGWNTSASTIIQSKIDITLQAMIEFNPENYAGGIAITNSNRVGIHIDTNGIPYAPTAVPGTNTTQIATTAFVKSAIGSQTWGITSGNISNAGGQLVDGVRYVTYNYYGANHTPVQMGAVARFEFTYSLYGVKSASGGNYTLGTIDQCADSAHPIFNPNTVTQFDVNLGFFLVTQHSTQYISNIQTTSNYWNATQTYYPKNAPTTPYSFKPLTMISNATVGNPKTLQFTIGFPQNISIGGNNALGDMSCACASLRIISSPPDTANELVPYSSNTLGSASAGSWYFF